MSNDTVLRILHVLNRFDRGGLESRIMDLYRKLNISKYQFDFYIESGEHGEFDDEAKQRGAVIYYGTGNHIRNIPDFRAFSTFIAVCEYKYICAYNQWSGWYLREAYKKKIPYRIAGSVTSLTNSSVKNVVKNIVKKNSNRYANCRMAVSELSARWLFGNKEYDSGHVKILPNAIDSRMFVYSEEIRRAVRKSLGLTAKFVLVHVGNIRKVKNQEFILRVVAELADRGKNVHFLSVGKESVGEGSLEQLKCTAEKLGISGKVSFLGYREDVSDILQAGDVFVFPSLYEGFPGAVLEAEASGLPCVISDSITQEVVVASNVKRLPLDRGAAYWADEILKTESTDRKEGHKNVIAAGYDVNESVKKVESYLEKTKDFAPFV